MTTASTSIEKLISYSVTDWAITTAELTKVMTILGTDSNISQTVIDLNKSNYLDRLTENMLNEGKTFWLKFSQLMGARLNYAAASLIQKSMAKCLPNYAGFLAGFTANQVTMTCHELIVKLRSHGVNLSSPTTSPPNASLIGGSNKPFSGVGASGKNATKSSVPVGDQLYMLFGHNNTLKDYRNPIGGLGTYLATLTPAQRLAQARSLVRQPISSVFTYAYQTKIPSRADIMRRAGVLHKLEPALIAGFILAEQRDQSKKEDAVEYNSAISVLGKNTSIGLGQIVVSTARRNKLFQDLTTSGAAKSWSHKQIATLLASDEYNIFGVARFLRKTADSAISMSSTALSKTKRVYPAFNPAAYAGHSRTWPTDNIKALGSEYTSRAWDGKIFGAWADFVYVAYQNVKSSGVF